MINLKMLKSIIVSVVIGFLISFIAHGCSTDGSKKLVPIKTKTLNVGITANFPPIVFKEDKTLKGLEVEMARALGNDLKRRVVFKEIPFNALIPALETSEIDIIMSGLSITADRKETVLFAQPYMRVGQMAIIRKADMANFTIPANLYQGTMRVGFEDNTTGEVFVRANLMKAEKIPMENAETGFDALRDKDIDVFIHDAPTAWKIAENFNENDLIPLYWPLTEEYLAWAVKKDNVQLQSEVDSALSQWKSSGVLQTMINNWVPVKISVR